MPAEIVTVGFCPQYYSQWEVQGSKGNTYSVVLNGGEGAPYCSCPAFKYSGEYGNQECKHVKAVWAHGCLYNPQWKDAGPNDYADHGIKMISHDTHTISETCPGCGEEMIPVRIAV